MTQLTQSVTVVVSAKDGNVFGETTVFIDGRRSEVRTQETTAGNLSADANLFVAQQVDPGVQVSIKNGGGIRAEIGEVVNNGDETLLLPPDRALVCRWSVSRKALGTGASGRREAVWSADAPQEQYWSRCSNGSVQGAEIVV